MHPYRPSSFASTALAAGALLLSPAILPVAAQDAFPSKPISIIVPFAPGGNIDTTARTIAPELSRLLGQPVVVENRAGAGGIVGAAYVSRAKPDGYTLLLGNSGPNSVANAVSQKVPYDGVKSFTPIGAITTNPSVLTVSTQVPASDFASFREYSRQKSGGASIGIAGHGSYTHLVAALINLSGELDALVVPYKGTGPAATDLMGHQIDAMVDQITTAAPLVRDGRVKAVAQTGETRSALLPDVPTMIEQGHPELTSIIYTGLFAPAGLPDDIAAKLAAAVETARNAPDIKQRFQAMGADVSALTAAQFPAYVAADAERWAKAARDAKITMDE